MIREDSTGRNDADASYTAAAEHSTAAALGKQYAHEFPVSQNPDKRPDRTDDGRLSSGAYVRDSGPLADCVTPESLRVDYHHPLENWLARRPFRWLLRRLSRPGRDGTTALERIITSYRNPAAPRRQRVKYWLLHRFIDRMRGETPVETFRQRLAEHRPTVRGLVIVARSIAEFGLTVPQKFVAPLFAVWNFTNRCNLSCKHCYQDSDHSALADELTLAEKLDLVDQMGAAHMPMLAFSGGEPTVSSDLLPVLRRANVHLHRAQRERHALRLPAAPCDGQRARQAPDGHLPRQRVLGHPQRSKNYCGGCRARADAYYGQLHAGDPGCIFNDKHWDALVEASIAIRQDAETPAAEMRFSPMRHGPG